jgi:hypothetical protein
MICGKQPKLKLEVGKFYRTRDGQKVMIYNELKLNGDYAFAVCLLNGSIYCVTKEGRYDSKENRLDIIKEWGK